LTRVTVERVLEMKLNLGCGKKYRDGYINIDIQEPYDLKHDLRTPLPFVDNSVDEILADDFIRLLSREEWKRLKGEISRVLKEDGKVEIICLDLDFAMDAFLKNKDKANSDLWIQLIFGGQDNEYEFCKNCFTPGSLIADLFRAGFVDFKTKQPPEDPDYKGYFHLTCYKRKRPRLLPHSMRVLIGAPIHVDDPIEEWLENVSKLQLEYPADLLLVDNSPGLGYVEKVRGYCEKYGVTNYKIKHLDINQNQPVAERIGRSREIIRQEVLSLDYDAWFSLEPFQFVPAEKLMRLLNLMSEPAFEIICAPSWAEKTFMDPDNNFGCAIIKRKCLEKRGFLLEYPDMPDCWHGVEVFFKKLVIQDGYKCLVI